MPHKTNMLWPIRLATLQKKRARINLALFVIIFKFSYAAKNETIDKPAITQIAGCVTAAFPVKILINAYAMKANAIPCEIEYVSGMATIAKTAGADSEISFHSIPDMCFTNRTAT